MRPACRPRVLLPLSSWPWRWFLALALGRRGLLAGDRPPRTLARARVGMGALPAHGQVPAMSEAAVAPEVDEPLDAGGHVAPQVAFELVALVDHPAQPR